MQTIKENTTAVSIAAGGAVIAFWAGLPAPYLTGSALSVTIASIVGIRSDIHPYLRNLAFVLIGIAMGSSITPEVYEAARYWYTSFSLLAVTLVIILWVCPRLLKQFWKLDSTSAFLASSPGHLSFVLGLTMSTNADIATVSIIQSIRVLMLTLVVPLIVTLLGYEPVSLPGGEHALPVQQLFFLFAAALGLAWCAERQRMPAAYLLCGMAIAGASQITGVASGGLHPLVAMPSIVVMGAILGTRFSGVSKIALLNALSAGLCVTAVVLLVSALAAIAFSRFSGLPVAQLLIAFAPGGVEAMAALALMLDADPAFVAAHHAWRLVVLMLILPFWIPKKAR